MTEPALLHLDGPATMNRLDEIRKVYATAFPGNSVEDHQWRTSRQANSPGFETVIAQLDGRIIGFVYGLPLAAGSGWWNGLTPDPGDGFTAETGTRTFAVIDLAVLPDHRGQGLGRRLMDELLRGRHEDRATLATDPAETDNQAMYDRWGWRPAGQVPGGEHETSAAFDLYVIALRSDPDATSSSR
ncbi:GNAT family N-acetyltransferase [Actinoallomurus vinaceus]